jgi:hypothetical protein
MRFIALQDPADNWMVYDQFSEVPAGLSGRVLHGLSREVAQHLTNRANMCSADDTRRRRVRNFALHVVRRTVNQAEHT